MPRAMPRMMGSTFCSSKRPLVGPNALLWWSMLSSVPRPQNSSSRHHVSTCSGQGRMAVLGWSGASCGGGHEAFCAMVRVPAPWPQARAKQPQAWTSLLEPWVPGQPPLPGTQSAAPTGEQALTSPFLPLRPQQATTGRAGTHLILLAQPPEAHDVVVHTGAQVNLNLVSLRNLLERAGRVLVARLQAGIMTGGWVRGAGGGGQQ